MSYTNFEAFLFQFYVKLCRCAITCETLVNLIRRIMKKKTYEEPTMQVFKLEQKCQILAGSDGVAGVKNYDWNNVDEE